MDIYANAGPLPLITGQHGEFENLFDYKCFC
jgi:hypothetical protein